MSEYTFAPTLADVRRAAEEGEEVTFKPMLVVLCNYVAKAGWPRKFFYNGCTGLEGTRQCCKSIDGADKCKHNAFILGTWMAMYRFELVLEDESTGPECKPPRVTVFQAAKTLLGMNAEEFSLKDKLDQVEYVQELTAELHTIAVVLRTKDHEIFMDQAGYEWSSLKLNHHVPRQAIRVSTGVGESSRGTPVTPGRTVQQAEDAHSSSKGAGIVSRDEAELATLTAQVAEITGSLKRLHSRFGAPAKGARQPHFHDAA